MYYSGAVLTSFTTAYNLHDFIQVSDQQTAHEPISFLKIANILQSERASEEQNTTLPITRSNASHTHELKTITIQLLISGMPIKRLRQKYKKLKITQAKQLDNYIGNINYIFVGSNNVPLNNCCYLWSAKKAKFSTFPSLPSNTKMDFPQISYGIQFQYMKFMYCCHVLNRNKLKTLPRQLCFARVCNCYCWSADKCSCP